MKTIIKKIIFFILKIEARLVLFRYKPKIIAISGTVGKTTTKDAIFDALSGNLHVRKNQKSMNSDIGVPLTILGLETGWNDPVHWLKNIFIGFIQIFYHPNYPKWLILEVGIDRPNDMKKTASWLKPDVAVLTAFGEIPVHVEFFEDPDDVTREEADLVNYLKKDGIVILNADDEKAFKIKSHLKNKVYTFGKGPNADIVGSNYAVLYKENFPIGASFKINYDGKILPVSVFGVMGDQIMYPILAAFSVAFAINLSPISVTENLLKFRAPKGRMNIIRGKNNSILIDDSYNSSPIALTSAINNLAEIKTEGKKIAVLGDMTEIGRFSASEHRKIGSLIKKHKIDFLITIGFVSELINDQAIEDGMAKSRNFHFSKSTDALEKVLEFLESDNVFLVKGSQSMRMEKISKIILADGLNPEDYLVRQESEWLNR
ncbi:MAG TPA: UDP-N-acetylmuramoyl-tripeptide--D-alanyl-D-alanine ligase [Candidatus Paceibacterota bacterium]|nr:UDP-N-acetylmuramoyl-tripeptide--D-alanyl-D-alanine ligase [Candidatus Paceibacterota bacterium]HMP18854.1 UDP-N-acetylmuramoyl-tripeptide--D-alanyl-D-alanine ligase [Candidatus Paceibacterota bacterium]HMP85182.1 UDP-N-acetylmuramoyl-tripeptide--D-alanyl-D-alanine ligase [Candidatus Paceibacterota bacterium]